MTDDLEWQRSEVHTRIDDILAAAKSQGTQTLCDTDGSYAITYNPPKMSLEELFSKPGITSRDD